MPWKQFYTEIEIITIKCIILIFNKLITEELLIKSFFPLINTLPNIYFLVPPCPSDYKYSKNILYNISL